MSTTLSFATHEHHDRLKPHIDAMPEVGDLVGHTPPEELRPRLDELADFLDGLLIPHMDSAERSLYPELERKLQNRHSMGPMRREHQQIRELVASIGELRTRADARQLNTGDCVALRRSIFRLYALLKVHLAEEELYAAALEHGESDEEVARLASALDHEVSGAF
jgi:iron-sulfur cluster repair protein YtfE (RIC family)